MIASTPRTPRPSQQRTAPALERQSTPCSPPPLLRTRARPCLLVGWARENFPEPPEFHGNCVSFSNPEFREVTNKK